LRFWNFRIGKNLSLSALVALFRASLENVAQTVKNNQKKFHKPLTNEWALCIIRLVAPIATNLQTLRYNQKLVGFHGANKTEER
ncbi:MAG: hypothetical protein ACI4PL_08220, partial [Faecousia sp.]